MAILILSGPVGAGKTTVGRALLSSSPDGTAYIEGDVYWQFLAKPLSMQQPFARFTMTMRAILASAWHYHRDGYLVIVDFSVPPAYLDGAKKLFRGEPFHFVVLRPSRAICAARAGDRREGAIRDYARFDEFYRDFDTEERFVISDGESTPATIAERIRTGMLKGEFLVNA